jgi:AraC family transcriptional regulator
MTIYSIQQPTLDMSPPRYSQDGLSRHALRVTHEYIVENLGERVTLDDLAKATGLSRFHFARQFRRSTGETPMRYVQRCRVEHAKRLIRRGELLMTEIAVSVGFCDQSHFSRAFRKLVGMTPREFADGTIKGEYAMSIPSANAIRSDCVHGETLPAYGNILSR